MLTVCCAGTTLSNPDGEATAPVRAPRRRRPQRRVIGESPAGVDLAMLSQHVTYVGSPEHKSFPSFAGSPNLRSDASRCDPELADPDELTRWLREAIAAGHIGEFVGRGFPATCLVPPWRYLL
jgi:hypothetical protein